MPRSTPDHSTAEPFDPAMRSAQVLRGSVDLFVQATAHEPHEIKAFGDLMCGLLPDAEPEDRRHAGLRLARRPDLPLAVARLLAMDRADVAAPVIVHSPVLTSADLVQIMRCGPEHVRLVAERLDLGPDLTATLTGAQDLASRHRAIRIDAEAAERRSAAVAMPSPVPPTRRRTDRPSHIEPAESPITTERRAIMPTPLQAPPAEMVEAIAESVRPAEEPTTATNNELLRGSHALEAFFSLDAAGRWRAIQEASALAALTSAAPRRRRAGDPSFVASRLFGAAVRRNRDALERELAEALDLDWDLAGRIIEDDTGEPLAVALCALGIDERTATSILLLHAGEGASLSHMQDLAALAGRIGWRTADHLMSTWRGTRAGRRTDLGRQLDPADRPEAPGALRAGRSDRAQPESGLRQHGLDH